MSGRTWIATIAAGTLIVATAPAKAAPAHEPAAVTTDCTWKQTKAPAMQHRYVLYAVSADSDTDAWAIGDSEIFLHYDGTGWTSIEPPGMSAYQAGVAAISPTDAWAVGRFFSRPGEYHAVLEHWNGTAWSAAPAPAPAAASISSLWGISADGPGDVWAVGSWSTPDGRVSRALIEHFDGTRWRVIAGPDPGHDAGLSAVVALGPTDVWTVGLRYSRHTGPRTLTEHFDGTSWTIVSSPNAGSGANRAVSVSATSASDAWLVGSFEDVARIPHPLTEHWDGSTWSVVAAPQPAPGLAVFNGVAAVSPIKAWAVGSTFDGTIDKTLIERWDGSTWSIVPGAPQASSAGLAAVWASPTRAWAVGFNKQNIGGLIERCREK